MKDEGQQIDLQCRAVDTGSNVSHIYFRVKSALYDEIMRIPLLVCYNGLDENLMIRSSRLSDASTE